MPMRQSIFVLAVSIRAWLPTIKRLYVMYRLGKSVKYLYTHVDKDKNCSVFTSTAYEDIYDFFYLHRKRMPPQGQNGVISNKYKTDPS